MADSVATQLDIGGLTLHSLSSFSKMLAAFSADEVAPTAMIQMEQLGSMFLISGKYADRVPDLLQRCPSVRLDRLAVSIGWRKGDSASIMANSAGGQAIALLSLVLGSLYYLDDFGNIWKRLSERLIPESVAISSVSQLASVGRTLRDKLVPLGFGNYMAQRVERIYQMYERLGRCAPTNLLNTVGVEAMSELLECISRSLREKQSVVRFFGTYSAGYILSVISMLFPHDTLVTLEGIVVEEGIRQPPSIIFELGHTSNGSVEMGRLEVYLEHSHGLRLPIMVQENSVCIPYLSTGSFRWHRYIVDAMMVGLAPFGLNDIQGVLQASCNLLLALVVDPSWQPKSIDTTPLQILRIGRNFSRDSIGAKHQQRVFKVLRTSLGAHGARRVAECCRTFTGLYPSKANAKVTACFSDLHLIFRQITTKLDCYCDDGQCWTNDVKGFGPGRKDSIAMNNSEYYENEYKSCPKCVVWRFIGLNVCMMFWSLFIHFGENTVVPRRLVDRSYGLAFLDNIMCLFGKDIEPKDSYFGNSIHKSMLELLGEVESPYELRLALGIQCQVVVPSRLLALSLERELLICYTVLEGSFMLRGHQYQYITNEPCADPGVNQSHCGDVADVAIVPSNVGVHSSLLVTIRERLDGLALKATMRVSKTDYSVCLLRAISASYHLKEAIACQHDPLTPLESQVGQNVRAASVAASSTDHNSVLLVMTKGNPQAQLLACRLEHNMLLARDCCLNCAYYQLMHDPERVPHWPSRIIL